jgi:hypothetical protein
MMLEKGVTNSGQGLRPNLSYFPVNCSPVALISDPPKPYRHSYIRDVGTHVCTMVSHSRQTDLLICMSICNLEKGIAADNGQDSDPIQETSMSGFE